MTKQGFKKDEHEVLVINDGSTDNSESVIDEFCSRYDYFVKVNKENGGVSSARNLGLDLAKGDYIAFIDGDDMFAENGYLPMLEICYKENLDAFYFGYTREIALLEHNCFANKKVEINAAKSMLTSEIWRIIFRRSIIIKNNIYFDLRIKYSEDFVFSSMFSYCTTNIRYCIRSLYFYRQNEKSAVGQLIKSRKEESGRRGKVGSKSYDSYWSHLYCASVLKDLYITHNDEKALKINVTAYLEKVLWSGLRCKYSCKKVIKDLKENNLFLKDITFKSVEGKSLKLRLMGDIQYRFRYKWFYRLICWMYRLFVH